VLFLTGLKTLLRTAVGGGASQRDLDVIVAAMRQRLLAGKTNQPPKLPRLSPQFLRKRLDALQLRECAGQLIT
jgi:hypothetical protein